LSAWFFVTNGAAMDMGKTVSGHETAALDQKFLHMNKHGIKNEMVHR
jgi:hypothetical protein